MHVYLSGIGGAGLYPLALLGRDSGIKVSGSDVAASGNTAHLQDLGVAVVHEQSRDAIRKVHQQQPIDWLIVSSAISPDSPEIVFAREANIPYGKRHDLINYICQERGLGMLAVAGTHGKTSTTSLLIWVFAQLGIPASHIVGGNLDFAPAGRYQAGSHYLLYEADEYDRNFLHFTPVHSLITSLDFDHPDTYPTQDDYDRAFTDFAHQSGGVTTWAAIAERLLLDIENLNVLEQIAPDITLPGTHNRANASLVLAAASRLTLHDAAAITAAINSFPGVARRLERITTNVYSDYAHHPAEIAATIQSARELSERVVVVYQPHQNLRQHRIRDEYGGVFSSAERVYWLPTFLSREDPELPVLEPAELYGDVKRDVEVVEAELDATLAARVREEAESGAMVVAMGAGSIDAWLREYFTQNR